MRITKLEHTDLVLLEPKNEKEELQLEVVYDYIHTIGTGEAIAQGEFAIVCRLEEAEEYMK